MNQETKENFTPLKKTSEIPYLDESIFNSKIFIHLAETNESPLNNSYTQESDNISEKDVTDEKPIDDFLINELIEQIDLTSLNTSKKCEKLNDLQEKTENKIENFSDILLPLAKNGYEFLPKSYKLNQNKNKFNNIENNKEFEFLNNNKNKKKGFQERRGDWKCALCHNLNFAFRMKCNRCQALKEKSIMSK